MPDGAQLISNPSSEQQPTGGRRVAANRGRNGSKSRENPTKGPNPGLTLSGRHPSAITSAPVKKRILLLLAVIGFVAAAFRKLDKK